MAQGKRDALIAVSPKKSVPKRRKDERENEEKQRTKYHFGPTNSLNAASTPLKSLRVDLNTNIKRTPSKPSVIQKPDDQISSDDHIFWVPTPQQPRTDENKRLSSSPTVDYKNIRIPPVNPINSLPYKYESINFDNFSTQRSPDLVRRNIGKSDSFPGTECVKRPLNESSRRLLKSFTSFNTPVSRPDSTKRNDVASLINTVESGTSSPSISSIIPKKLVIEETPLKPLATSSDFNLIRNAIPVISKSSREARSEQKEFDDSSDFFSEDFSDDFINDLDKALAKKSQTVMSQLQGTLEMPSTAAIADKLSQAHIQEKAEDITEGEDDITSGFSDSDDDLFDNLLLKKTQGDSHIQPRLSTQEMRIQSVDREGLLIFKKDIEETDTRILENFKKADRKLAKAAVERDGVHRYEVTDVREIFYVANGLKKPQKLMTGIDGKGALHKVFLRDMWETLDIQPKDVIHIVGQDTKIVDNDSDNLLVWNPDLLLSATLVSDTINCQRRAVLKTKLDFPGEYSVPLIVGEIVHTVFQEVLKEHRCSMESMQSILEEQLEANLLIILSIGKTKQEIQQEVLEHLPYIKTWFDLYVREKPSGGASIKINRYKERTLFATSNIIDIEENIVSPLYGLRGLIDVTIEAYLLNMQTKGRFVAPMELKSGRSQPLSHKSQAALYTLLMKDRYEMDVSFFMLVYTKLKETTKCEVSKRELKELMMLRNRLSQFMKEGRSELPDLIRQSQCDVCYAQEACMTINKLVEDGTEDNSGLKAGLFNSLTEHLDNLKYKKFYEHWDDLVTKEEGTINLLKKDLFLIDSETRERTSGKCLANLVIESSQGDESEENASYLYTFKRKSKEGFPPMNVSQLSKHDHVIVSDEAGHFALCSGFITALREDFIVISTKRRLRNNVVKAKGFNDKDNQTFQTVLRPLQNLDKYNPKITFRVDKDEMFHGMKLARYNILNLFLKDGDSKRRKLIVDDVSPRFDSKPLPYRLERNHSFNPDQIRAFDRVLSAKDYSLLLGMPGTGKTTVIAELIRFLTQNQKTVLLTSYTHSAVDNILMKVKDDGIGVVRLGNLSKIHPEARIFSPLNQEIKNNKDLQSVFLDPPVVATTCLGIGDWVFNRRRFDYCIVDESSQVSMPVCLGPLRFCDKFVLVGDHFQLPPLVQNPEAKAGLSRSLFKILSESHPESVVELTHQYRMCSDIMLLSNTLIYEGRLKCGSDRVANQTLTIPEFYKLATAHSESLDQKSRWLETVLDSSRRVMFLNHDNVGGCDETSVKENIENPKEADLVYQIVEAMLLCGVPEESIGVMSFYRAQLRLFYRKFAARKGIEMLTADQFQGRDKECVIISLVKSNDKNNIGSLLKEWRRVNVAITRAKSKLIIVGSKRTLQNLDTLNAFMKVLDSRGWFYDLPPKADAFYSFLTPEGTTTSRDPTTIKKLKDSKAVQNKPLAREIAEEMGI
jgi:DNA replication ATP-dependent helicase Dna2